MRMGSVFVLLGAVLLLSVACGDEDEDAGGVSCSGAYCGAIKKICAFTVAKGCGSYSTQQACVNSWLKGTASSTSSCKNKTAFFNCYSSCSHGTCTEYKNCVLAKNKSVPSCNSYCF